MNLQQQIHLILLLMILTSSKLFGQKQKEELFDSFHDKSKVQAFIIQDTINYISFYSSKNGKVIDSLLITDFSDWICVAIDCQSDNWVKLNVVGILPREDTIYNHLSNSWIEINKLWIGLSNDSSNIYKRPFDKYPYKKIAFQTVNLVNVNKSWSEIKYKINDKTMTGWVQKEDQCGFPWTTCNWD